MVIAAVDVGEDELPHVAAGLAGSGTLAWLDGDGSPSLGRRSFLSLESDAPRQLSRVLSPDLVDAAALETFFADLGPLDREPIAASAPRATVALSYDLAWAMKDAVGIRTARRLARSGPLAFLTRHRAVLALDHDDGRAHVVADDDATLARALSSDDGARDLSPARASLEVAVEPRAVHAAAITAALDAIGRGDLYQVNLARRSTGRLDGAPLGLALAMRRASPVPLGAYLEGPDGLVLIARTMERFLSFDPHTGHLETRPIKGTKRRGDVPDADVAHALRGDAKERAEHAMIVDLMRNDLGRLAVIGSVRTEDVMRIEAYARLSHMVSTVRATARPGLGIADVLLATFPPGSVTGAPKASAIEHIEALERHARGFYTGALGHVARDGTLSLAVAIRTATVARGDVTYFAGGGIVEASDPEREVDETELKAAVLEDARRSLDALVDGARVEAVEEA